MTQFGEPIDVGMIDDDDVPCPFDHDPGDPPTVDNILIGDGQELGKKMRDRCGTHLYDKVKEDVTTAICDPRDPPTALRTITIELRTGTSVRKEKYPLTCAAHHCVPAQESVKKHNILQYMVKKGATQQLKDATFSAGKVWSNVGYDVNGSQNGIYLPGSYAVGGGTGGTGDWASNDDPDNEKPAHTLSITSTKLTGRLAQVSFENRKWLYVSKAVASAKGQFHDRHVDYSKFVKSVLTKIWENYEHFRKKSIVASECGDCKKRANKIKELGIPTPFGLVSRMNKVSDKFKSLLNGTAWSITVYTSRWGKAYIEAALAKNPAANAGSQ